MNPFVEHLPWRIAALSGLIVGAVSYWAGTDLWTCLVRMGIAVVVFGLGGLGLRSVMRDSSSSRTGSDAHHRGVHVDHVTPPMNLDDVIRPVDNATGQGNENE